MNPFEAVFFDMDGTFVNSEPHWLAGETELMAEYGHAWTKADQQYCLGGPLSKVGRYMWELAGEKESPEWFHHELVRRTLAHFHESIEYMPGALELLQELVTAGVPCGLVTASPAIMMDATLSCMDKNIFDTAVSGDDVVKTKPDPSAYILAAKNLGVDITRSIVIEDSLTGIAAGKAAGAFVLAVPTMVTATAEDRIVIKSGLAGMTMSDLVDMYIEEESGAVA